ncbi:MAG: glycoside hydrolase/phage tail family protein, partial [Rubellimicrobium sp.]|nr:glycoside hydrolase/phage tail family protein [Rubellimicrobium sp.]
MATLVLASAGMAIGGSVGGSVLGLSSSVIGRAAGAALGRSLDERLLGAGSGAVETGRVDRFRLTGASEGAPVAQLHGRMRMGAQVIWASQFSETTKGAGSGKGTGGSATEYSYTVSLALALCEGVITHVGRIWADGVEIARDSLALRVYRGTPDQLPDPRIEAVEGAGSVPAFRGIAYLVIEDLALGRFGNRVPQFSVEVFRPGPHADPNAAEDMARLLNAVALIPGTGEYSLATSPVYLTRGYGETFPSNINSPQDKPDMLVALDQLTGELPNCGSVLVVVSWFGSDLRCGDCLIKPKVEQVELDGDGMPWRVTGLSRPGAEIVPLQDGNPVYGGTPSDRSVIEAIRELARRGQKAVFYPFILMEQMAGNTLPDPWTGATGQPPLPWRGRITLSNAPGREGSPDQTAAADAEVAQFFGTCTPADFPVSGEAVGYTGPPEWSFRRMILHYAHLCAAAGGVDAFCIGSEMRGVTQIRGADGFPAVQAFCQLAAEVKAILPDTKVSYAADWSEYHGYQPPGTGDKLFHLDPLWADPNVDFIGIDNYMPLSDWRDGEDHADAAAGSIYNLDYLTGNVAGGEGYDWFYHSPEAEAAQIRTPIGDFWGEHWVWRYKDIRGWWLHQHRDRVNGTRSETPTAWEPRSKPIWFTEIGCAAIDKGTNEPNKFLDPKSSESFLPKYSNGIRDEFIQMQYLRALHRHWADPKANPWSSEYGGRMVDMRRAHVWAWDARPWPQFPARTSIWADGPNYPRGHWITGRASSRSLAGVVREICQRAGITGIDTSRLWGTVKGYRIDDAGSARAALQPLMLAYGFDAVERDGKLVFATRDGHLSATIPDGHLALEDGADGALTLSRAPEAEVTGRIRIGFVDADGDYEVTGAEAVLADDPGLPTAQTDLPLALTRGDGIRIAERWLAEARVARDEARLALPPSLLHLGPGDVVSLTGQRGRWRIDRREDRGIAAIEAVRIEPEVYRPHESADEAVMTRPFVPPVPVQAVFLDLPLMTGGEVAHAPHLALTGQPWPGAVALLSSSDDSAYAQDGVYPRASVVGTTQTAMFATGAGVWDNGPALRVRLVRGALSSVSRARLLAGANLAAIGDGLSDL